MTDHQRRPPPKSRRQFPVDDDFDDDSADDVIASEDAYEARSSTVFPSSFYDGSGASVHHGHFGGHHVGGHHG